MSKILINYIAYTLGEHMKPYNEAQSFEQVLADNKIPNNPKLFGWGNFYQTEQDIYDLAISAGNKSIELSGLSAESIDLVIFCCRDFEGLRHVSEDFYKRILAGLGLTDSFVIGITLNSCTSLLSALDIAKALISSGSNKNVMVISSDKVNEQHRRMSMHSLYSDGAVACILSSDFSSGYRIVGSEFVSDHTLIGLHSVELDMKFYAKAYERLFEAAKILPCDIKKIFTNNIYLPVVGIKEGVGGLSNRQIYTDNVRHMGHCFSADALINLADYQTRVGVNEGEFFVMSANAQGLRGAMIITPIGKL